MKTEKEVQDEVERLKKELDDEKLSGIVGLIKFERLYALKWVLEEENDSSS